MNPLNWKDVWSKNKGPQTQKEYFFLYLKGLCMGTADLIPGVSGGTIAFITGIYEDLLEAAASLDRQFFSLLLRFKLKEAFSRIPIRFMIVLVAGIATAILSLARLMHFLMNEHPIPTWALFFGLIAASIIVVGKHLKNPFAPKELASIVIGAIFAYVLVSLIPVSTPEAWWFIFLCGVIGITAMILPGISGSFLLLILGKYEFITGAVKNPFDPNNFVTLIIFLCGTATGLLSFTKVLNYFLKRYHDVTMGFLTGILIGSMKKVWPWKEVLESTVIRGKVRVIRDANIIPHQFDGEFFLALFLMIAGFFFVMVMDLRSQDRHKTH